MNLAELNNRLTLALKNYIKASNHVDSGRLIKSIKFKCTDANDGGLKIKFNAMEYIHYLDNGEFIAKFFALDSTVSIITEYLSKTITLG